MFLYSGILIIKKEHEKMNYYSFIVLVLKRGYISELVIHSTLPHISVHK